MSIHKIETKEISSYTVISKREIGTYGGTIPKLIGELMAKIFQNGLAIAGPMIYICHDEEYKEEGADIEVAIPIQETSVTLEEAEIKELPGGKAVTLLHQGAHGEIGAKYGILLEYIAKNNLEIKGPNREGYLKGGNDVPEKDQLTELQFFI